MSDFNGIADYVDTCDSLARSIMARAREIMDGRPEGDEGPHIGFIYEEAMMIASWLTGESAEDIEPCTMSELE